MVNSLTMKLRTYLDVNSIGPADFAGMIKVSTAALHRYMAGDRIPRPEILERISNVTNGAVKPNDFFAFADSESEEAA